MADSRFKIKNGLIVEAGPSEVTGSLNAPNITGSLFGTASWALNAVSASFFSGSISNAVTAQTASFVTASNVYGPFGSNSIVSSSYALTASFALNAGGAAAAFPYTGSAAISGSLLVTGSVSATQGGFTGSLLGTASWAQNAVTASYVQTAQTASYVLNAVSASFASTASFVTLAQTASFVATASWARNAVTASYITGSVFNSTNPALSASYALTASYVKQAESASFALTSSYAINMVISGGLTDVDYIDFDRTSSAAMQDARLKWDEGEGTLQLGLKGNVDANIGEQIYQYVYNAEATTLTKATVVYVSGSQGGRIAVKRASATAEGLSAETLGLAAEDIAAGSEGWVITDGSLRGVNTSGLIGGRLIFLSSSAGQYTQTYPQAPLHGVRLGYVQKVDANPNQGILYIKIDNGYELDELHDVRITSASSGELLVRSGSLWINTRQMTGSYGLTGSLTATTVNASFFTASGNAYPTNSGVSEYFLQTNGAGTLSWNYVRSVLESVKNVGSTTLVKGTPVYVTSSVGNTAEVVKADAGSSSLMPATYILNETLTAGQQGLGIVLGFVNNIDTSLFNESDQVYVNIGGGYTNVQPTGSALIQPLGTVVRVDATNGSIMVSNTGVTNSLPNINPGYAWVGATNWLPTAVATSSFFVNSASLALTASSGDAFTVRNFIELKPGSDPGTANVSSSYLFVTTSADDTEFNLHYRNNGALWETHWLEERTDTGIVWGGVLTFNSTTMSITPGAGLIINHNANTSSHGDTVATYVPFGPITASATFITSSQVTYLLIDENGQLVQQTTQFTPEQYNEKFPLGYIFCLTTSSISSYADARITTYGQTEQGGEFIRAFGPLKLSGYDISPQSGSLKISIASGETYRYGGFYTQNPESPSQYNSSAVPTGSLVRIYRDPAVVGGFRAATNAGVPYTDIDPTKWDNGSGTLQTVSASQWSIQRVFEGVVNNISYVYYGQNVYDSLALALQSITTDEFVESPTSILALPFIGYIIAKGDATNLADTANNRIIQAGLFRNTAGSSGGGGAAAQSLDDLSDVTITGPVNGQALIYNAGLWVNGTPENANFATTASYVLQAVSSSFATTASYVLQSVSASFATNAATASFVTLAQTASFVATASWARNAITASFVTTAQTASYVLQAVSASFATNAATASFVTLAQTASYVLNAVSSSFSTNAATASSVGNLTQNVTITGSLFVSNSIVLTTSGSITVVSGSIRAMSITGSLLGTSSWAQNSVTASYILNAVSASFATTASYVLNAVSSSFATTASYVLNAVSSSFATNAATASFVTLAQSASYVLQAVSASFATNAATASFVATASWANNAVTASYVTGSVFSSSNPALSASYALTASFALNAGASTTITVADEGTAQGTATFLNFIGAGVTALVSANTASITISGGSGATFPYTGSAIISGSLVVTGSTTSTFGFTGSLLGTSSWANNAVSASYYEVFPYTGSAQITGSLGMTGSISMGERLGAGAIYSLTMGSASLASGFSSVAIGREVTASGIGAVAIGFGRNGVFSASGDYSVAFGYAGDGDLYASGYGSFAHGDAVSAIGSASHAEGQGSTALGSNSHAEGYYCFASSSFSHAEGNDTRARGLYAHTEGEFNTANARGSHAEGTGTETSALAFDSHAEGFGSITSASYSHAEGFDTITRGESSHAEGEYTLTIGKASHAEGRFTSASGLYSHAEGSASWTRGAASHAEGWGTVTSGSYQLTVGQWNFSSSAQSAFIIGNGTSDSARSNLVFASGSQVQVTGSVVASAGFTGSLFGTASFAVSASWAPGGSGGLVTKAGSVANTSFAGNPRKATVTFGTAFANTSYAIVITGEDSRAWSIESKAVGSFVINANSNVGLAGTTYWIATAYGETT